MMSFENKKYPDRRLAEDLLNDALHDNPGRWGEHSEVAAACAEKIAAACGLGSEKAYVLGLLHDIGRKFLVRDLGHIYNGYKYMLSLGFDDVARVCLTHSFPTHDLKSYIGKIDIPDEDAKRVEKLLDEIEFDDYDRLIQLCDALASADGVVDVEERMADVKKRYGSYPRAQWDKNLELLDCFSKKAGKDVYEICGK